MTKEARNIIVRITISFLAIAVILVFMRDKLQETWHILRSDVAWGWILAGLSSYVVANLFIAYRLKLVFKVQHIVLSFKEVCHLIFVGLFFNLFLPSAVGGDLAKAYYAYKHSGKKMEATTSVLLDRLIGFVVIIGLAMMAVFFFDGEFNDVGVRRTIVVFGGIMIFTLFFLGSRRFARRFTHLFDGWVRSEKWRQRLSDIYHALYGYKNHYGILFVSLAISLIGQFFFILTHYLVTVSLGVSINPWIFFIIVPMIAIASMAPSIGGLGVREAGAIYLFSKFMPTERAFALALLLDVLIYGVSLASGVLYALRGGLRAKLIHEMEEINQ